MPKEALMPLNINVGVRTPRTTDYVYLDKQHNKNYLTFLDSFCNKIII